MINKVMVVGAGQMGSGIAQVCAQAGYDVILHDEKESVVKRAVQLIERMLERAVDKEGITTAEKAKALAHIETTNKLARAKEADLVIEAIIEDEGIKRALFRQLTEIVASDTIIATNTSSISITRLARETKHPENVIGMHFMNPVPVMKLVEVIPAIQTNDASYETVLSVVHTLNKTAVTVQDFPGFAANRILMPMINEAIYAVYEGVARVEDIDKVMTLGMHHPMGPLTLADFIGLDTCLAIMEVLFEGFGDSKYRPCPLLKQYVHAGWTGKKSGRGFYHYEKEGV